MSYQDRSWRRGLTHAAACALALLAAGLPAMLLASLLALLQAGCQHGGDVARRAEPTPQAPGADLESLWEIDTAHITPDFGTGGLDPVGQVPERWRAGGGSNGPPALADLTYRNGFYYTGPGKVLPECALRLYTREQLQPLHSETRRPEDYRDQLWSGPQDLSALVWLIRDERDLTIMLHVTDDILRLSEIIGGGQPADAVMLFFDVRRDDRGAPGHDRGVFALRLEPSVSGDVRAAFEPEDDAFAGVRGRCRLMPDGYRMIVTLPIEPMAWRHMYPADALHFDVALIDSDTPGERDSLMVWSGDQTVFNDARRYGRLRPVRRGFYLTAPVHGEPPPEAVMTLAGPFHVRGGGPGGGTWESPADCSARAWVEKDESALRAHVEVRDDVIDVTAVNAWERDGIELFFDLRDDEARGEAAPGRGVFQVILPAVVDGSDVRPQFGGDATVTGVAGIKADCHVAPPGYVMDIFIPFAGLVPNHMLPGERFNFDVVVNDADTPKGRDTLICWAGDGDNWRNAAAYGRLEPLPAPAAPVK